MRVVLLLTALQSLASGWLGIVEFGDRPAPLRVELSKKAEQWNGTFSLPFEGLVDQPLASVTVEDANLHFEYKSERVGFQFQGKVHDQSIKGTVTSKDRNGSFDLVRTTIVPNENYFGAYEFEKGKFLYIRTFDELGEKQLTYLDEEGHVGPLNAVSQTEFFTGPGLWIPLPKRASVVFEKNNDGKISGLTWTDQTGLRKAVKRDTLFHEEEIVFTNGSVKLSGSVVLPEGKGPFPAMVFVHGSGATSRDFFGPVSYLFARHGIAVLSYEKRGVGKSTGHWLDADFADYSSDAIAGVNYLKSRKEIDPRKIGLWGGSQAGWIIPQAVEKDPSIAFAVMFSVPGVTPYEQEVQRSRGELMADGASQEQMDKTVAALKSDIDSLRTEDVKQYLRDGVQKLQKEGNQKVLNASGADNPRFLLWYTNLLDYSPVPSLEKMKCPVLVLYGEIDRGVPVDPNKAILDAAFKKGGNSDVTFHVFPKGNHVLMLSETGGMKEFPHLTQFVPDLFPTMVEWIQSHTSQQ